MTNIINKVIKNGTEYQIYASGGAAITVDSELSTTSTNPAQNKVITTAINGKAADDAVVKLTGNQTVAGTKTFSTSPKVPSKNSSASSSNKTVIATEAQVALKQDALTLPSSPTSGHIVTWGANNKTLADGGSIPTVNNSTITFTQGGVSKGTITTNQSSASTIALDAGGSYDNITKSEIQTGTATTQRTVSASVITSALPRISALPNNILTSGEIWAGNLSDYKAMGDGRPSTTLFFCIDDLWKPGANTIAYYPLTSTTTTTDQSGNSRNLTNNGTLFGTYQGVDCAYLTEAKKYLLTPTLTGSDIKTISVWTYWDGTFYSNLSDFAQLLNYGILNGSTSIYIYNNKDGKLHFENNAGTNYQILTNYISGAWYNLVITIGTDTKMYINGNYIGSCASGTLSNGTFIFGTWIGTPSSTDKYSGGISNWIIENKAWTAQEISDYYNQTKGNYGL